VGRTPSKQTVVDVIRGVERDWCLGGWCRGRRISQRRNVHCVVPGIYKPSGKPQCYIDEMGRPTCRSLMHPPPLHSNLCGFVGRPNFENSTLMDNPIRIARSRCPEFVVLFLFVFHLFLSGPFQYQVEECRNENISPYGRYWWPAKGCRFC
jgi:hypothetical protein